MSIQAVLAVDEGTSNCKAILVDQEGAVLASAFAGVNTHYPRSGWVEQDASEIWASTIKAIQACLAKRGDVDIIALGISNQRESALIWDRRTGKALGPVVSWQCRRTAPACEALKAGGHEPEILARTGLMLDPLFSASKLAWLLEAYGQDIADENVCVGTVDSWLIWNFTGGLVHATDGSNAARTQLFNLADRQWDTHLCELFGVPPVMLPQVFDSSHIFGTTRQVEGLPDGIAIAGAIGDSHGALFGHGGVKAGDCKITFGTGSSVMMNIAEFTVPPKGVTTTIAWSLLGAPTYALEGNILVSASILPWTAALLGLGDVEALLDLAQSVDSCDGVCLVPAHVGLGSPHWKSSVRGLISGLSFTTGPAHLARAAIESMALQVHDVMAIIKANSEHKIERLFVDGGPSQNQFIMGMVANYLDHPVTICKNSEASAIGAAYLAGLGVGFWPDLAAIAALTQKCKILNPDMDPQIRQPALQTWQQAINQLTLNSN